MTKRGRLVELVRNNPGLNGTALKAVGWSTSTCGSLFEAERDGAIVWRNAGWFVTAGR